MKHIFFLCIMLLFGNTFLYANNAATPLHSISYTQNTNLESHIDTKIDSEFYFKTTISNPVVEFYSKKGIVNDVDEEDTQISVAKKKIDKSVAVISFNQQFISSLPYYIHHSLAAIKENFYFPSYNSLYIVFEVFRI